jgi:hypothetical protein
MDHDKQLEVEALSHPRIEVPEDYTMPKAVLAASKFFAIVIIGSLALAFILSL